MSVGRFLQQAAAGNAGEAVYVDDVFSTHIDYSDSWGPHTATTGLDMSGEGGMVWTKPRSSGNHWLYDTERGATKALSVDQTAAEATVSLGLKSFTSTGFTFDISHVDATNGQAWWSFRKQPGFFDVVTYTGTGGDHAGLSHGLESAPGMIVIKKTSGSQDWYVSHRSLHSSEMLRLNSTAAAGGNDGFNAVSGTIYHADKFYPTSTANTSGDTYVAYLFAHDAQEFGEDEDEAIIKCGSYTGNGSATGPVIDLGFEPQWVMIKSTGSNPWMLFDSMRGINTDGADRYLMANDSSVENGYQFLNLTPTGFQLNSTGSYVNTSSQDYIYMAIRRPHKPASEFAATDLFDQQYGTVTTPVVTTGFPVDFFIERNPNGTDGNYFFNRLTGKKYMQSNSTNAESTGGLSRFFDFSDGVMSSWGQAASYLIYSFRRAPGFFDVVAYTGTGSNMTVSHNLNAVPELMILKRREVSASWIVYHKDLGNTAYLQLEQNSVAATGQTTMFNSTSPTDSVFSLGTNGNVNASSSGDAIAYLFATVPGISKVGSYTSTGSDLDIDCGFTNGARFVLIKRNESSSDWHLFDAERGIVAGNDPFLELNTTNAQDSANDAIDPISSGFTVTGGSICNQLLFGAGSTYIFLAIA